MADFFDSSVLVAAISEDDPEHESAGVAWDNAAGRVLYAHGISETYATLTGKRHPACLTPDDAIAAISEYAESVEIVQFSPLELLALLKETRRLGIRGGAVYDYLHICAARKAGASRIFTLNKRHFTAIAPELAPRIFHPGDI